MADECLSIGNFRSLLLEKSKTHFAISFGNARRCDAGNIRGVFENLKGPELYVLSREPSNGGAFCRRLEAAGDLEQAGRNDVFVVAPISGNELAMRDGSLVEISSNVFFCKNKRSQ